ncbi:MAG: rRNA pseudouridine synthase [Clostridia bacterium]|nr:rRNA pseudouridine synthase [Clostridia bacterium]
MRLDRFLAECGVGTRSEVKKLIRKGAVSLNGSPQSKADAVVSPEADDVFVFGEKIVYREFIYLMLNKPAGFISATRDGKTPTVLELVPKEYLHFKPFPVGRLDIDTEGLLLLTNDGDLAHRLLSPKKHIPKTYLAEIEKAATPQDIEDFSVGVVLDDGYKTMPAKLTSIRDDYPYLAEVVVNEGKFHQVKRMFEAVGNKVLYLKRTKMNDLELDQKLELGEVRELTKDELLLLQNTDR